MDQTQTSTNAAKTPRRRPSSSRTRAVLAEPVERSEQGGTLDARSGGVYRARRLTQQRLGLLPADASVGDRHPVDEFATLSPLLFARAQIALEHHAHDDLAAVPVLLDDVSQDLALASGVLAGVVVRAVDEDRALAVEPRDQGMGAIDARRVVVGPARATAQHDVAVGIAQGPDHGGHAVSRDTDKTVWVAGRDHR